MGIAPVRSSRVHPQFVLQPIAAQAEGADYSQSQLPQFGMHVRSRTGSREFIIIVSLYQNLGHDHLASSKPTKLHKMASTTRLGMRCARQLFQPSRRVLLRPEHIRQSSPIISRLAPFSTTVKKNILPPGPQVVHGGVNDPAPVPDPHPTHG